MLHQGLRSGFGLNLFTALFIAACGGQTTAEGTSPNPVEGEPDVSTEGGAESEGGAEPEGNAEPNDSEEMETPGNSAASSEENLFPPPPVDSRAIPGLVLIEDGEDNDARIIQDEALGWDGYWYTYDDKSECTNMTKELGVTNPSTSTGGFFMSEYASAGIPPAPLEGVQSDNLYGVRIWGGGHTAPSAGGFGAGLGFAFDITSGLVSYDLLAQGFVGIRFQVRSSLGDQPLTVKIKDAWSEPAAVNCIPRDPVICDAEGCHDDPLVTILATPVWTLHTLMFSDFLRAGLSMKYTSPPPDNALHADVAYQVQFEIASPAMFDLWFDNIGFVLGDGAVAASASGG